MRSCGSSKPAGTTSSSWGSARGRDPPCSSALYRRPFWRNRNTRSCSYRVAAGRRKRRPPRCPKRQTAFPPTRRLPTRPVGRQVSRSVLRKVPDDRTGRHCPHGLSLGLTNYGDPDFALYLHARLLARWVIRGDAGAAGNRHRRHGPASTTATAISRADRRVKRGVLAAGGLPWCFRRSPWARYSQPDQPHVPQPDGDGHRGDDPRPADGRTSGRRLRQDGAGPADMPISANRPAIGLVAGPMRISRWQGERLGACTDCWRGQFCAGESAL